MEATELQTIAAEAGIDTGSPAEWYRFRRVFHLYHDARDQMNFSHSDAATIAGAEDRDEEALIEAHRHVMQNPHLHY